MTSKVNFKKFQRSRNFRPRPELLGMILLILPACAHHHEGPKPTEEIKSTGVTSHPNVEQLELSDPTEEHVRQVPLYCDLKQDQMPSPMPPHRSKLMAHSLEAQDKLQEAIWIYEQEGSSDPEANRLKTSLKSILETKPFKGVDHRLGGTNEKQLISYRDTQGMEGIFKPSFEVHTLENHIPELIAYQVDQILNLRVVPMTVRRSIEGRSGTIQYFVQGARDGDKLNLGTWGFRRLKILDYLIGNRDRSFIRNFLFQPDLSQVIAIDHGNGLNGTQEDCGSAQDIAKLIETEKDIKDRLLDLNLEKIKDELRENCSPSQLDWLINHFESLKNAISK